MKQLVCIPTYNERENISNITAAVLLAAPQVHILVIDDNSPDKTGDIVRETQKTENRIHLLSRAGKQGLGKAYLAGFAWGLQNGYDVITEMDADFSHRPADLVNILNASGSADFFFHSPRRVIRTNTLSKRQ